MNSLVTIDALSHKKPINTMLVLLLVSVVGMIWLGMPLLPAPPASHPQSCCSIQSKQQSPSSGALLIPESKEENNDMKSLERIITLAHQEPAITFTVLALLILIGLVWYGLPLLGQITTPLAQRYSTATSNPPSPACGAFSIAEGDFDIATLERIINLAHKKPTITLTTLALVALVGLIFYGLPLLSLA